MSGTSEAEQIAIIGMSGRFPGAGDVRQFWRNLRAGVESIRPFTDDELAGADVDEAARQDRAFVNAGAPLDGVELFDAAFFGLSPREAEILDPQRRLILECAWEALEDAGCDPRRFDGSIGVFAGSAISTYLFQLLRDPALVSLLGSYQILLGNDKDHVATYLSYKLDLRGPSIGVQTACSTSLVAVCQACQSLLSYQCDLALAGGVSIHVPQAGGYRFQEGGISSPDGHCRAFDAEARGTVGGNGLGLVVLKRLGDALAARDPIRAVIRGFALNNDGANKAGYTAPSQDGQAEAIAMAQAMADLSPDEIGYVEAHGTGTPIGDPIELAALRQAFAGARRPRRCAIGSVKTNIGHLDVAAGVAGLIKTVLALQHRELPASLHFTRPNPRIDFAAGPFYVNAKLAPWESAGPRRAGVSSFGIGGTNAHVVLEEAPPQPPAAVTSLQLLLVSARTPAALAAAGARLAAFLEDEPATPLSDAAFTTQVGRRAFACRRAVVAGDAAQAVAALRSPGNAAVPVDGPPSVAFLFPGQGAQHVGMAYEQYLHEPVFAGIVDDCARLLAHDLGLDLRRVLYPAPHEVEAAAQQLTRTAVVQPALFTVEYALARLWMSWGIRPDALLGHSVGEYVAACLAGVFSLEAALALVAARGRLMQALPEGAMLAVQLEAPRLAPLLGPGSSIASYNAPGLCVAAGPETEIAELERRLAASGAASRRLAVRQAFHSAMVEPMLERFGAAVRQLELKPPSIALVSNVTGTWLTPAMATDPGYWVAHARHPVRFSAGIEQLLREPRRVLLEVGPQRTLTGLAAMQLTPGARPPIASLPQQREAKGSRHAQLEALARLWEAGAEADWPALHPGTPPRRISLPTYPFERQRYWVDPPRAVTPPARPAAQIAAQIDAAPEAMTSWLLVPRWAPAPADPAPPPSLVGSRWLFLLDAQGGAKRLAERAARLGATVAVARAADAFGREGELAWTLDPSSLEHHRALLTELSAGGPVDVVCQAWTLGDIAGATPGERCERALQLGLFSLGHLATALGEASAGRPSRLAYVSDRQVRVAIGEPIAPEKATALGACRALAQEMPGIGVACVDVRVAELLTAPDEVLDRVLAAAVAPSGGAVVALRGGVAWQRSFEPAPAPTRESRLRPRGVYLITGGLGGVGLAIAERMAAEAQARLVLLGRTPAPDEAAVQCIEAAGGEVMVTACDVADPAALREVLVRVRDRFGPLNGIVHAAGVPGGRLLQLESAESAAEVLRPKLLGTLALDEVCADEPLDFVVLCSSLASITGGVGQAAYAGANAFLDAWAASREGAAVFTAAIAWCTWREAGMAARAPAPDGREDLKQQWLAAGISNRAGAELFLHALGLDAPHLLVVPPALQELAAAAPASPDRSPARSAHARPPLAAPFVAPRSDAERHIAAIWEALLGIAPIGVDDSYFDLGGHSLLAVQLGARLREAFGVEMTVRRIFDAPTVAGCAAAVEELLLAEVEKLSPAEVEALLQQPPAGAP